MDGVLWDIIDFNLTNIEFNFVCYLFLNEK